MDTNKSLENTLDRLDELHRILKAELTVPGVDTNLILQIVELSLEVERQRTQVLTWLHVDSEDA